MSADYDRHVMDLVGELAELHGEQRSHRLDELCGSDARLRARVVTLLDGLSEAPTNPREFPAANQLTPSWFIDSAPRTPIEQIGPYRLLRRIGMGGMAEVYEAEQDRPRRHVALKLIHPLRMTPVMQRRFEFEVEVLGRLEHPGIARVYDAGTAQTEHGPQPYFAMELVRGQRLDWWIATHKPDLPRRLRILIDICDAVQHAHQHGVIHRDLKPSNIMISEDGQVKVLDFGVARAVGADSTLADRSASMQTQSGQIIGTLQYMSPEQASGDVQHLDTRSDVYALGVIAYQLLSDRLPYDVSDMLLPEALRVIREDEPTRLSTINRDLRGDLETIVLKALRKEPNQRYATSAELAADVKRYLDYEPISARPPSTWYQFSKFARRNKVLVGSAAAIMLILLMGGTFSTIAWRHAIHSQRAALKEKQDADDARQAAELVNLFLNDMLASVDPREAQGDEVSVRRVLDRASEGLDEQFAEQPAIEVALRNTIGRTYHSLSNYDQAREQLARAVEVGRAKLSEDHPSTLAAMNNLGLVLDDVGESDGAEPLYRHVWEVRRRTIGENHSDTLMTLNNLACNLDEQARWKEAEQLHRDALARRRAALGDDHADTVQSIHNLGSSLMMSGRLEEAIGLLRESYERRGRALGKLHPATIASTSMLATCLLELDRDAEAEPLLRDIHGTAEQVFGPDHAHTLGIMSRLAACLVRLERHSEAQEILETALRRASVNAGADDPSVMHLKNMQAAIVTELGRPAESEPILRELRDHSQEILGARHPVTIGIHDNFASALLAQGKRAEGEAALRVALEQTQAVFGQDHPRTQRLMKKLAQLINEPPAQLESANHPPSQPASKPVLTAE